MRRRNYQYEALEIILALGVIGCSAALFFKARELTVLYPVTFGLAGILSLLHALEGIIFKKITVVRKSRVVIFGLIALALFCLMGISLKMIL